MSFQFNPEQLELLKKEGDEKWQGKSAAILEAWLNKQNIFPLKDEDVLAANELWSEVCNRDQVFEICEDSTISTDAKILAVLAWGGIFYPNAKRFFVLNEVLSEVRMICLEMQSGAMDRRSAFEAFSKLGNSLKGIGPAYFTKLMFFFARGKGCYILDQWTAKSVNVFCGKPIIHLISNRTVSRHNDANTYDHFCEIIEALARVLNIKADQAEMRIFSSRNGVWRQYVREKHSKEFLALTKKEAA